MLDRVDDCLTPSSSPAVASPGREFGGQVPPVILIINFGILFKSEVKSVHGGG